MTGKAKFGILERKEVPLAMAKFFQNGDFLSGILSSNFMMAMEFSLQLNSSLLDYSNTKI
jgi:hypothetical protein